MKIFSRKTDSLRRIGLTALLLAAASGAWGQATVTGMNQVSSTRVGRTTYDYTYTINVTNGATGLSNAVATVTSSAAATTIVQGSVALGTLAAGANITSTNTFTLQQDRTVAFNPASLSWAVTGIAFDVVPNVVGLMQAAASSTITGAGLTVGAVTTASSSSVPAGDVINEAPTAGANVAVGSAVNLTVSTGPAPVAVPNVVGSPQATATTAITSAGLIVGTVTTASSSSVPAGDVISETPAAGTSVAVGSAVNLMVSTGAASPPVVMGLGYPIIDPEMITAGTTATFTVSSTVTLPNVNPSSVNAQLSDPAGNLLAALGPLTGAPNGVYTGTFTLTQPPAGEVYVVVTAAQSSAPGTFESPVASIAVLPPGVPTDFYAGDLSQLEVDPVTGADIMPGEVIACFSASSDPTGAVSALAAGNLVSATLVGRFAGADNCYQLLLPPGSGPTTVRQAMATLNASPTVTTTTPDYAVQITGGTPCSGPICGDTSFKLLNFLQAQTVSTGVAETVAVLDTGVDYDSLPNVSSTGPNLLPQTANDPYDPNDPYDTNGHGTEMAGIILGIAPDSHIYPVKVANKLGNANIAYIRKGMHLAAHHAGVQVISLSMCGPEDLANKSEAPFLQNEVTFVADFLDQVVVLSAGNNSGTFPGFPGQIAQTQSDSAIMSVGAVSDAQNAVDYDGNPLVVVNALGEPLLNDVIWTAAPVTIGVPLGSNQNATLSGPGVDILASDFHLGGALPGSGTSQATAFVAGTAALVRSVNPAWTSQQVGDQLVSSVQPVYLLDDNNDVVSNAQQGIGAGRLDPVAALGAIRLTHQGHETSVTLTATLTNASFQPFPGGFNEDITLGSFYALNGDQTPCEARITNPCTLDLPMQSLPPGQYHLTLQESDIPPEDAFGIITLTIPGLTFVSCANVTTCSITSPTTAAYSLIGGDGAFGFANITLQQVSPVD